MSTLPWWLTDPDPNVYMSDSYVVLDFETTTYDKGSALNDANQVVLSCWTLVNDGESVDKDLFGTEYQLRELLDDIRSVKFLVAQNAKFELQWLQRAGLDLRDILVYDTFSSEWVINGNRDARLNLNDMARRYGLPPKHDVVKDLWDSGFQTTEIPPSILLRYCRHDRWLAHQIFLRQRKILHESGRLHLAYARGMVVPCLADIEMQGMCLDGDAVEKEHKDTVERYNVLTAELDAMSGGINMNSGKQLSEFLYGTLKFKEPTDNRGKPLRTAKDVPRTDSATLGLLRATNKTQRKFLELYKERNTLNAAITKALDFMRNVVEHNNSVFYGELNHGRTGTHRLSSTGKGILFPGQKKKKKVQFQNIDRDYKRLIRARREGWLIGEADGSQLEFRVAADMGNDPVAKSDIRDKVDIHTFTARTLTDAGQPTERQEAKAKTFKPLYGGSSGTPAEKAYYAAFRAKYNGIYRTQTDWTMEVLRTGELRTPYGMIFYWPGTSVSRSGYVDNTTSIFNFPVQGFATGEIIPIALVYFWHRIRGHQIVLVNTVHDSVVSEIRPDEVDFYAEASILSMTDDVYFFLEKVYSYDFDTPLGVGLKVGPRWSIGDPALAEQVAANVFNNYGEPTIKGGEISLQRERNAA